MYDSWNENPLWTWNPPDEYKQNENECMDSILKRLKSFKKLTVKETFELIQNEVENQQEHMKLALIGKSQLRICQQFKSDLETSEEVVHVGKWEKKKVPLSEKRKTDTVLLSPLLHFQWHIDVT